MAENVILLFCGCDKVGKSTIIKELLKRTNAHICVDRFTACQIVYGKIHCKEDTLPETKCHQLENFLINSPIPVAYVHVEAETEDIKKRFEEHNEKDISVDQIDLVKERYRNYFDCHSNLPIVKLNTSEKNLNECIEYILWFISFI